MKSSWLTVAFSAAALTFGTSVYAQGSSQGTSQSGSQGSDQSSQQSSQQGTKSKSKKKKSNKGKKSEGGNASNAVPRERMNLVGQVIQYQPGRSIQMQGPNNRTERFNLQSQNVDSFVAQGVKDGQQAHLTETILNGRRLISVESSSGNASGNAPHGGNGLQEIGDNPSGDVTLHGTVNSYNAGKSIVITDAAGNNHTFDLNGNNLKANVSQNVAPGSAVRLVQTVDSNGNKTIDIHQAGSSGNAATGSSSGSQQGGSSSSSGNQQQH